jgi:integrase
MRVSEAVAATTDHLEWVSFPVPGETERIEGWRLEILGKGNKLRRVPMAPAVMAELGAYLAHRGFTVDVGHGRLPRSVFLLGEAVDERKAWMAPRAGDPARGISSDALYKHLKTFFAACADALRQHDEVSAERLASASTHWLRHTHISHALAAGAPIEVVQQNAGHASLDTTTRYVTTEDARRMKAMQELWSRLS